MAVSDPELYNGYWVYMRDMIVSPWGSVHLSPSSYQINNAYKMRAALQAQGYCDKAIAGVIGSAQQESGLTTGAIQKYSVLPNLGESIADVPNSYMLQYYTPSGGGQGYGLGLLQWDRYSTTYQSHDLLGWTNANGYNWYDGAGQMARLDFEFNNDSIYHFWANNYGAGLTWAVYKDIETSAYSHYDAGECAAVWDACWERSSGTGREIKRDNANYWYQYFNDHPAPPVDTTTLLLLINNGRKVTKNVKRYKFG